MGKSNFWPVRMQKNSNLKNYDYRVWERSSYIKNVQSIQLFLKLRKKRLLDKLVSALLFPL